MYRYQDNCYSLLRYIDSNPLLPEFPNAIRTLMSGLDPTVPSKFEKTYLQSLKAEEEGLDEIAGMGYRKAIEYLVKDLAVSKNPTDVEQIKGKTLTAIVKDYFEGDIKKILERAVWLGNDQTHYFKIFEQFDLQMLKNLIDFVLSDLDRESKREHYLSTITPYNKS
ncbi:hypothetical protein AMR72_16465 [Flavobacterium psychrophilum]|nr:hypothetical protein AMR72_16465 [Flavobacterium psychrophilum]AOE54456.1 hypothetical protein ALW18_16455 [Flavobacterium psychrophilum]